MKLEILSDEELAKVYELSKQKTEESFNFAKNEIERLHHEEDERYSKELENYKSKLEQWEKRKKEAYDSFLKQEEFRKQYHESTYKSKLAMWESQKRTSEAMGKSFDESKRPVYQEYVPKRFSFSTSPPREPIKRMIDNTNSDSCEWLIRSIKKDSRTNIPKDRLEKIMNMFRGEEIYEFFGNNASEFFIKEMRKEKVVTKENEKKIKFLTLREHFINLREKANCDKEELNSGDPKVRGLYGEKLVVYELELMKAKNYRGCILHDLYIPDSNGNYKQIDVLFITTKGVFVIESKNYFGTVKGKEQDQYWNVTGDDSCEDRFRSRSRNFYNPILQNKTHIEALQYHLKDIPCYSCVVFSECCNLEQVRVTSKVGYVFNRYAMLNVVSKIFNSVSDVIDERMVQYIADYLKKYTNPSDEVKKAHNDNIRENVTGNYNNFESFDDYGDYNG